MYMQIRKYRVKSGSAEELCRQAADHFLPLVKKVRGFVDYMVIDSHDGHVMSISICEDRAGVEQTHHLAKDWHRQFSEQLEGPLDVMGGDIVMDSSGFQEQQQPRMAA
jgi:hypothetical protein